mgnify:CR=1 FL=1
MRMCVSPGFVRTRPWKQNLTLKQTFSPTISPSTRCLTTRVVIAKSFFVTALATPRTRQSGLALFFALGSCETPLTIFKAIIFSDTEHTINTFMCVMVIYNR